MREQVSIYGSEGKKARVGKGRSWMMIQSLACFCGPHGELRMLSSIVPSWGETGPLATRMRMPLQVDESKA